MQFIDIFSKSKRISYINNIPWDLIMENRVFHKYYAYNKSINIKYIFNKFLFQIFSKINFKTIYD